MVAASVLPNYSFADDDCASILKGFCGEDGIEKMLSLAINILTGLIVAAGTVGIIVCGVLWMTARDNQAQVEMAKRRIFEIVIGLVAWVMMGALINLLIPKTDVTIDTGSGSSSEESGEGGSEGVPTNRGGGSSARGMTEVQR